MLGHLHRLLRDYAARRSPWGPPWWVYAVAFAVANLARLLVIVTAAPHLTTAARVASWVATALLVVVTVNAAAQLLRRRESDDVPADPRRGWCGS